MLIIVCTHICSKHNAPSFLAGSHFLSSITSYQYSRKAWRKEAFELLLDPAFFQMEPACLSYWKVIVDHLMTHDKTTFRDFLSRMTVTQSGSLKLFSSKEQENEQRSQLAKRLAFVLFCSEKDQYHRYMPEIQGNEEQMFHPLKTLIYYFLETEKLIDCLRTNSSPTVQSQILLCFRVLLLRMSHHHLTSLWPFIYTEMVSDYASALICHTFFTVCPVPSVPADRSGAVLQLHGLQVSFALISFATYSLRCDSLRNISFCCLFFFSLPLKSYLRNIFSNSNFTMFRRSHSGYA